ncbi:MAG: sigma-54 dependent transcriptional regulator [bacterium]
MNNVLLIDDSKLLFQDEYTEINNELNMQYIVANNGKDAADIIKFSPPDIILIEGIDTVIDDYDILKISKESASYIPIILFTEKASVENAVKAIKDGVFDYIQQPFNPEKLKDILKKAISYKKEKEAETKQVITREIEDELKIRGIVYESSIMRQLAKNIVKLAKSNANVFIFGESGTGKELVARNIHNLSSRNKYPFIPVDCVSFPATLLEGELFGFEKGAFTGAVKSKPGVFELAENGSLFLDEITEMDYHMQAKLLRVLQERKVRRLGGKEFIEVNVRIISATNRDPEQAVKAEKLREDLYYRLNVVPVYLPPLKERKEDIPLLVHHFISKYNPTTHIQIKGISNEALKCLIDYNWPGNIRELENLIHRIMSLSDHDTIELDVLPEHLKEYQYEPGQDSFDESLLSFSYHEAKKKWLERFNTEYFTKLLEKNDGNISKAAKKSGVSRKTFYRMLKEYNINR